MRVPWFVFPAAGVLVVLGVYFLFFISSSLQPVQCVHVDRVSYGLPLSVFESLPPLPACIISSSRSVSSGSVSDLSFFTSEYYLQPEFYPSFLSEGLSQWTSPV